MWRAVQALGIPRRHLQMVKVTIAGLIGAFLIFYIMTSPDQAANIAHSTWHATINVAHGIGNFLNKLVS
jgi:hypothetical protein